MVACGEPLLREALVAVLSASTGTDVVAAPGRPEAVMAEAAIRRPEVVLVCGREAGWDDAGLCGQLKDLDHPGRVLVVGPSGDDTVLLAAMRAGADGYVESDESVEDLVAALHRVHRGEAPIPPGMLGTLLRSLIEARREDDAAVRRFSALSAREQEVLALVVAGCDRREIGKRLYLSPHTARTHIQNILAKLGVHSQLEASTFVLNHGLLERFGSGPGVNGKEAGDARRLG
jgi:DNA-binding NarL/FixJ family response regulator